MALHVVFIEVFLDVGLAAFGIGHRHRRPIAIVYECRTLEVFPCFHTFFVWQHVVLIEYGHLYHAEPEVPCSVGNAQIVFNGLRFQVIRSLAVAHHGAGQAALGIVVDGAADFLELFHGAVTVDVGIHVDVVLVVRHFGLLLCISAGSSESGGEQ